MPPFEVKFEAVIAAAAVWKPSRLFACCQHQSTTPTSSKSMTVWIARSV
jgi:hypothetical protein